MSGLHFFSVLPVFHNAVEKGIENPKSTLLFYSLTSFPYVFLTFP